MLASTFLNLHMLIYYINYKQILYKLWSMPCNYNFFIVLSFMLYTTGHRGKISLGTEAQTNSNNRAAKQKYSIPI